MGCAMIHKSRFLTTLQASLIRLGMMLALLTSLLGSMTASAAGETWSPLGDGLNAEVYAIAFDSSGNLYAGGSFTTAGGSAANYIAKWDGSAWSALGSGMNNSVYALAFDNSGNLYAGGIFTTAGGVSASRIARWDGSTWSALGSGLSGSGAEVSALAFDSSGSLYAGGSFTTAGGAAANRIARWNGSAWSALGDGTSGRINTLAFDSSGNLYAGGSFTTAGAVTVNRVAKWDGSTWSALGGGVSNTVRALAANGGGVLYAGGSFATASGVTVNRVAKWNGSAWSALGSGMNADIHALAMDNSGNLYAGGEFTTAGGASIIRIAKWDGATWSALGSGMNEIVRALAFENGIPYAGGNFTSAGGASANRIARWAAPLPGLSIGTSNSLFCTDENATITIGLADVVDLFGYQFIVHYNASRVSASAAFVNTFFDTTTDASIPSGWNASCSSGECKFAASKVDPGEPLTGSGTLAQITLTGASPGTFNITISDDILSDRDAQALDHTAGSLSLTICGYATVSGTVSMQGRAAPVNSGQVTLTDLGGIFGPYTTTFNPTTGAFTISNIKVMPTGSNYQFDAAHGLYLGNRTTHTLNPADNYAASATRLLGGDANNDGVVDISDLTCIGGSFGSAPVTCGTTGSSDINADGAVNILDLVLPGSNFGSSSPRTW